MKKITFAANAFQDFTGWATIDQKIYKRIVELVKDIVRQPFTGLGKPEPLKHELKGYWSRRINDTHRLVYKVGDERLSLFPANTITNNEIRSVQLFIEIKSQMEAKMGDCFPEISSKCWDSQ